MDEDTPRLEIATKFKTTWRDTPTIWRILLVVGLSGFVLSLWVAPYFLAPVGIAIGRTLLLAVALTGIIANKLASDDFYKHLYTEASVFCMAASAIILFGAAQLGISPREPLYVFMLAWWAGFAIAFMRMRAR